MNMFDIAGKRAIVTGASRGLGFAMAQALKEAGASLAIISSSDRVYTAAGELGAHAVRADLGDLKELERGFNDALCALGGVDIEIDQNEYLAIRSILLGKDPNMPDGPGLVHMTGRIALAYMRTRSTGSGGDFARTERQRKVVSQLFDKCRDLSLMELVGLYNSVSSGMKMSLSAMDILSVLSQGYALMTSGADFVEYRIPQDGTYSYGQVGSSSVLDVRWKTNRTRFHALLDNEP